MSLFLKLPILGALSLWNARSQYNTIQYNIIQYRTVQYNTIQYNTIQYNAILHNTIQYSAVQYSTIQYNTIQYNTIQYNITNTIRYNTIQEWVSSYTSITAYTLQCIYLLTDRSQILQHSSRGMKNPFYSVTFLYEIACIHFHNPWRTSRHELKLKRDTLKSYKEK